ncbi:anti-sigma factor antagonist [Amycolatopsis thermoflava]|uniref:anti-sigma factor antagonist n=1 Tax=Amycolatopsis thermoflava TaxID=84480 RepID=UPI00364FD3B2
MEGSERQREWPQDVWDVAAVTVEHVDTIVVVTARGDFDLVTVPRLRAALAQALAGEPSPAVLVVDLTEVTFFGAAAMAALLEAGEIGGESTELRLAASEQSQRFLRIGGLDQIFTLYRSLEGALST